MVPANLTVYGFKLLGRTTVMSQLGYLAVRWNTLYQFERQLTVWPRWLYRTVCPKGLPFNKLAEPLSDTCNQSRIN